jgi:hypothetical protein
MSKDTFDAIMWLIVFAGFTLWLVIHQPPTLWQMIF